MNVIFINPNLQHIPIPNLGLAYLVSSVETKYKVDLIDLTFHSRNYVPYLVSRLKENPPDVVGISVTTFSFPAGLKIASLVKQLYPGIPVIFGGVHSTLLPEETIIHPEIDAVCIGEGEDTILEYLACLKEGLPPKGVAGLWYKDDGQLIKNPLRPFKEDLDTLPFPNWDYWEVDKYIYTGGYFTGSLSVLSSRGCPYNCTFCSNPAIQKAVPGRYYRLRHPGNVIDEIKLNKAKYWDRGFRNISFSDEVFGLDDGYFNDFCTLYMRERLNKEIFWSCQTRVDFITESWAEKASNAGCAMVSLGIESGDDYIRIQDYKKNITREQILKATNLLYANNIPYVVSFLVGCPRETKMSIGKSIELARQINPAVTYFLLYQPLPKTELAIHAIGESVLNDEKSYQYHRFPRANMPDLKISDLEKIMLKMRGRSIYRFLIQGLQLKGFIFIWDIIKYILSIGDKQRITSLSEPFIKIELQQKTINSYILEKKRKITCENCIY